MRHQAHKRGGAGDRAAVRDEIVVEDGFGDFFRDANIEWIPAAAQRQVNVAQHGPIGMNTGMALFDAQAQERVGDAQRVQYFD
ncbi:hypothetical protein D3C72_2253450 [compost metagenome]